MWAPPWLRACASVCVCVSVEVGGGTTQGAYVLTTWHGTVPLHRPVAAAGARRPPAGGGGGGGRDCGTSLPSQAAAPPPHSPPHVPLLPPPPTSSPSHTSTPFPPLPPFPPPPPGIETLKVTVSEAEVHMDRLRGQMRGLKAVRGRGGGGKGAVVEHVELTGI